MKKGEAFISGQKMNDCTFISEEARFYDRKKVRRMGKFLCHCGKEFICRIDSIKGGGRLGCVCLKGGATHGHTKNKNVTPEYTTWIGIKSRCYDITNKDFGSYGGRNIMVCDKWKYSFEEFYKDMGNKLSSKHSIERINVNGNYEPSNCKWATIKEQARNKTTNILITYNEETHCVAEWAEKIGMNPKSFWNRLNTYKWSVEKSITTPLNKN